MSSAQQPSDVPSDWAKSQVYMYESSRRIAGRMAGKKERKTTAITMLNKTKATIKGQKKNKHKNKSEKITRKMCDVVTFDVLCLLLLLNILAWNSTESAMKL